MAKKFSLKLNSDQSKNFKQDSAYEFTKDIRSYLKSSLYNSYYLEKGFYQEFKNSWESDSSEYSFFKKRMYDWILDQNKEFFFANRPSESFTVENYIKPIMLFLGWDQSTLATNYTLCDSETSYDYDGKIYRPDLVYFNNKNDQEKVQQYKAELSRRNIKNNELKSHVEKKHSIIVEAKKFGFLKPSSKIKDDIKKDNTNGKSPEQQVITYMEMLHSKYAILTDGAVWKFFHDDFRDEAKCVSFDLSKLCLWLIDKTNREGFRKGNHNFLKDEAEFNFLLAMFYNLFSKEAVVGEKIKHLIGHTHTYSGHLEESIKARFVMGMNHACNGLVSSLVADGKDPENYKDLIKKTAESHLFSIIFFRSLESRDVLPYTNKESDYRDLSISKVVDYLYEKGFNPSDHFEKQLKLFGDYYQEAVNKHSFVICKNLMRLYSDVQTGKNSKLHIKGFKQSIFAKDELEFAEKYKIPDEYMMNVIFYLNLIPRSKSYLNEYQLIPYDFLTPREIGSIFESFLEFELRKADRKIIWNHLENKWESDNDKISNFKKNEMIMEGQYHFYSNNKEKRILGAVYTPHDVVSIVVKEALGSVIKGKLPSELLNIKVIDPAMGSGHFLKGALDFLTEAYITAHFENDVPLVESHEQIAVLILSNCILGVDKNKSSVKLAKMSLWLATANQELPLENLDDQLVYGDTLLEYSKENGLVSLSSKFDHINCVLGNPPYVKANEPGVVPYRKQIKDRDVFETLHKKWDLFIPFIELALGLVKKQNGTVGFVVQDSLSYAPFSALINKKLEVNNHCRIVSIFEESFPGWAFPAITFIYDYAWASGTSQRIHNTNRVDTFKSTIVKKDIFKKPSQKSIQNKKSYKTDITLGSAFYVSKGMVLNVDEKKLGKKVNGALVKKFKKDDLITFSEKASPEFPVRFLDVEDIGLLKQTSYKKRFVEYGLGLRAPLLISRATFPELHQGQRILLSSSKKGRACILYSSKAIVSQNTRVLKRWDDLSVDVSQGLGKKLNKAFDELKVVKNDKKAFAKVQQHSKSYSYKLIAGILSSKFFLDWIGSEKRAKHNVSPDVISEFPLPRLIAEGALNISAKEFEDFRNYKKLNRSQLVNIIEILVDEINKISSDSSKSKNLVNCLDFAVSALYS